MSHELTGSPNDGDSASGNQERRQEAPLPTTAKCMRVLDQLSGLVALRILKPAQANAMVNVQRTMLDQLRYAEAQGRRGQLADGDLLELMRRDPTYLSMLSPLLTDEQVDMLMRASGVHETDASGSTAESGAGPDDAHHQKGAATPNAKRDAQAE